MASQQLLEIIGGPGRWQMMLAVFDSQRTTFTFEERGQHLNGWEFEIDGGYFSDAPRGEVFKFSTWFPHKSDNSSRTRVQGEINLRTRQGYIDITPLVEIGQF